jgi:hypothetical protein
MSSPSEPVEMAGTDNLLAIAEAHHGALAELTLDLRQRGRERPLAVGLRALMPVLYI